MLKRRDRERSLVILKPDIIFEGKIGILISSIEDGGFSIAKMIMKKFSNKEAALFYKDLQDKPFFRELYLYMASMKVVVLAIEKVDAIEYFRRYIGDTDPKKANPGTLREQFGTSILKNAIHASDCLKSAKRELAFFKF